MRRDLPIVVFDTNIYIQAFLNSSGESGQCFSLASSGKIELFITKPVLEEIVNVINRPSVLSFLPDATGEQIEIFVSSISEMANVVEVPSGIFNFSRDPKDEIIVELAVGSEAEFIVTRDNDLLELMTGIDLVSKQFRQRFRGLKVVEPKRFLQIISKSDLALRS